MDRSRKEKKRKKKGGLDFFFSALAETTHFPHQAAGSYVSLTPMLRFILVEESRASFHPPCRRSFSLSLYDYTSDSESSGVEEGRLMNRVAMSEIACANDRMARAEGGQG